MGAGEAVRKDGLLGRGGGRGEADRYDEYFI